MKRNREMAAFAVILVVLAFGFYGCAKKSNADKIRLGIMAGNTLAIAVDVAVDQGFFVKHGIDVEVTSFAAGINTIDAITIGQLDIGEAADFAILNRIGGAENSPLRIFSGYGEIRNNLKLYTADPSVTTPADLAGKSVVTRLGTVWEYYYARTFALAGVAESQIKYLPVDSPLEAVALVQAGTGHAYYANGQAEEALKKISGVHSAGNLSDYVEATVAVFVTNEQFAKNHQPALEKFLRAIDDSYQYIREDPPRAAEIAYKTSGIPTEVSLQLFNTTNYAVEFNQNFYDALDSVYQWAEGAKVVKYPYDLHKFIDTGALKATFPGRGEFR
jgi:NitT/TauT family transport system substrate-binding protein